MFAVMNGYNEWGISDFGHNDRVFESTLNKSLILRRVDM
jgi:hypothetical protein